MTIAHRIALVPWILLGLIELTLFPSKAPAQEPGPSTLERIKQEGVLRWGADPSGGAPFVFFDPKDPEKVVGFEMEIMDRLAARMGVKPELIRGDWASLIDNLKAKRTDLAINGLEMTPARAEVVTFTTPYYLYEQQLTVRTEDRKRYGTLKSLEGKKVAVLNGSASVDVLRAAGWTDDLILQYDDSLTPYEEVKLGRAEAAMAESIIASYYAGSDAKLYNVPETFNPGSYAAAARPEDTELVQELNRHLEEMKRDGELAAIYKKWNIWTPRQQVLGIFQQKEASAASTQASEDRGIWWALLMASLNTLLLTLLSMPLALFLGLVLALMSLSPSRLISVPAWGYIQVIRGTPLLVQIYLIYFSLPQLGILLGVGELFTWPSFLVGVVCLAANYAAYEAEIHRAGIQAVPRGQTEAALSLGMSEQRAFHSIVLPQSFRIILPPVLNDVIAMLKDSCLVSVIGVKELLAVALGIGKARFAVPELLMMAAVIYLVLSWAADWLGRRLEAHLKSTGVQHVPTMPGHG